MSWRRVSKDAAHPGTVAACKAVGIGILEVNAGHWGGGPEHLEMQAVGAGDFVLVLRGFVAVVELKTPGADHGGSKRRKDRDKQQSAYLEMMRACGLPGFRCVGVLEVLAVIGCTAVEARRGLIAAGFVSEAGTSALDLGLGGVERMLSEARQRLGLGPTMEQQVAAVKAAGAAMVEEARADLKRLGVVRTHDGPAPKKR